MGKRRGGKKQHKKLQHERSAAADGNESDEMYDEVDRFNNDRNKISTDLTRRNKRDKVEEVLNVEADELSDDQEEVDGDFDDSDDEEMEEGDDDELSGANKWGNKRSEFYGSSYVDEDWGGVNASDEEAIDLEEEDALARQKKLDAALACIDYGDAEELAPQEDTEIKEDEELEEEDEMSAAKMMELFNARRPEYEHMVDEYKDKKSLLKSTIAPLKKLLEQMGTEDFPLRKEIEAVTYIFASYFSNLIFYMHYVHSLELDELAEVSKHPIIEQIMKIKKYLNEAESLIDFNERQFRKVCAAVEENKTKSALKILARIAGKLPAKPEKSLAIENKENEFVEEGEETGEGADTVDDDEKRKITYEIEKNKGLTAKRKKTKKHSRIQKRVQFHKAVVKRRSQVPDVRRETAKYSGEARGIRASTVKSIKLKA
ncbi:hypothetical protein QR680_007317 [Steinernema hermaphroditum]|uniref:Sas10 C-terminal domain-containing protein n=1 Tax=Steinernema hermaphroditum TaxID=289476 RepID=A0AA39ICT4_9BILA|nr:hypothetical protein QR680_007317 [Steinernema hermaphroditum]